MGTAILVFAAGVAALLWASKSKASPGTSLPAVGSTVPIPVTLEGKPTVRKVAASSGNVYTVNTWPEQSDGKGLYNFAMLESVPGTWIAWRVKLGDPNGVLVSMHVPDGHGDALAKQMMVDFLIHPTTVKKVEVQ